MKNTRINPDREYVKIMRRKLKDNSGFCPSALSKLPRDKCPCEDFRKNTADFEWCTCGLYQRVPDEERSF